jgi:phage terminase large subunit GpA-like protein
MWVMADMQMSQETVKERVIPWLESIPVVRELLPLARDLRNTLLLKMATMKVYVRGSNSKAKLQSTPIQWLFLDEVRNYRKGALELVLKRTRSFKRHKAVYISTPTNEGDAIHRAYMDGTQTMLYWPCPHCGHYQPFRWGKDDSPIFPGTRPHGGFKWDENNTTRPDGKWNFAEVAKSIRYECEQCQSGILEEQKWKLIASCRRVDTNPHAVPGCASIHAWAAYVPWVNWSDMVIEFLKAMDAAKGGDFEPLKAFVRETLGEPWRLQGVKAELETLLKCRSDFERMSVVDNPRAARILTVDVQQEAMVLKYVYRQHIPGAGSRLLDYGRVGSFEEIRAYQQTQNIKDRAVWIDTGHKTVEAYRACLRWGWMATKGDRGEGYQVTVVDSDRKQHQVTRPWKLSHADPYIGSNMVGKTTMPLIRFSSASYKDRLYLFVVRQLGQPWLLPKDIGQDYIQELTSDEILHEAGKRVWIERGTNDYGDCEILQLLAADVSNITKGEKLSK